MIRNLFFATFVLVSFSYFSQEPNFQWTKQFKPVPGFTGSGGWLYGSIVGMEQDKEGNLIVLGYHDFNTIVLDSGSTTGSAGNASVEGPKVVVAKFTKNGELLWHKTIEGSPGLFFSISRLSDLRLGTDESIVFGGHLHGHVDFDPSEAEYILSSLSTCGSKFVVKLNQNGDFIWSRLLNPDASNPLHSGFNLGINDIELDLDNNVYITGPVSGKWDVNPNPLDTFYIPDYHWGQDGYLLKLSSSGNFVWCKVFGTSGQYHPDNAHMIKRGLDNDLYFGCSYLDSIIINVGGQDVLLNHPPGVWGDDMDYFMAKMDTSGQFEWVTRIVGYGGQWIKEIEVDENGEIYACGSFIGSITMYPFVPGTYTYSLPNNSLQNPTPDGFVIKYTSNGDPIWGKVIQSIYTDSFEEIELDDKNVYLGGYSGDSVYVGEQFMGYLELEGVYNDQSRGTILQISKDGETGWMQRFESKGTAKLQDIVVDGNELFSSGSFSYETDFDLSVEGHEYLITEAEFKVNAFLHKMIFTADTFGLVDYTIYPNPFNDLVQLYAKEYENTQVTIFDVQGRLIRELKLESKITSIDLSNGASGVYLVLIESGEKSEVIRVVKE